MIRASARTLTGLPFVFAVWATRPGVIDRETYEILHASRRAGAAVLPAIAEDYTWNGRQYPEIALPYLRDAMRYRLGDPEVAAKYANVFPKVNLVTIADFGGWTKARAPGASERSRSNAARS